MDSSGGGMPPFNFPAYYLLRRWHNLLPVAYLGQQIAVIRDDPCLNQV
jgi:hypothetical protein